MNSLKGDGYKFSRKFSSGRQTQETKMTVTARILGASLLILTGITVPFSVNFVDTVCIKTVNTHSLNFVSTVHIRTVHTYSLNIYNVLRTAFATSATISEASGFTLFRRQQPSCAALSGEGVERGTRAGFSHDEMIRMFCALTGGRALLQSNQDAALFTTCQHREQ